MCLSVSGLWACQHCWSTAARERERMRLVGEHSSCKTVVSVCVKRVAVLDWTIPSRKLTTQLSTRVKFEVFAKLQPKRHNHMQSVPRLCNQSNSLAATARKHKSKAILLLFLSSLSASAALPRLLCEPAHK